MAWVSALRRCIPFPRQLAAIKLFLPASVILLLLSATSANAQSNPPSPAPQPCAGVLYVSRQPNNPFTAQRLTTRTSKGTTESASTPVISEIVARDGAGRIRVEKHPEIAEPQGNDPVVLHTRDGGQINTTQTELNVITMIFDCPGGKIISLQPAMKVARVRDVQASQPGVQPVRAYSFFFTSVLQHKPTAAFLAEDLGHKTIEGVDALGIKTTHLGTEDDEWKGKPIRISETWVSDDLAATLVDSMTDLKKNVEETSSLTNLSRAEPDPALFQIPTDYKINPAAGEMPFRLDARKPVPDQPHN
jgi:hypothetical protein